MLTYLLRALLRLLSALLMLAGCVALVQALLHLPLDLRGNHHLFALSVGFGAGLVGCGLGARWLRLYVIGHELTHWLAAKLFRRRTGRLRLGPDSGSIAVERPNIWIVLSPYFVPLYPILWSGAAWLIYGWYQPAWFWRAYFVGLGLLYAYHLGLTLLAIGGGQDDLRHHGRLYSLLLIVTVNLLLLTLTLTLITNQWPTLIAELRQSLTMQLDLLRR